MAVAAALALFPATCPAFPIGGATFKDDAPFKASTSFPALTSGDGLLTVAGWADPAATVPANLYQWWWILGVNSGSGNVALVDQAEAVTLQLDTPVGVSHIAFLHSGGIGGATNNLARVDISGFLTDPGAYATVYNQPRIFNLTYRDGTLSFEYLWDTGGDFGQLLFANPAASRGQRLKITGAVSPAGDATGYGLGLFRVSCQEVFGRPTLAAAAVRHNVNASYTTPDGALTVRAYSDSTAQTPASLGTYVDQCFGVYGARNTGAIDSDESVTLQFAPGVGLGRLDAVYSSGQVSISGFSEDPGFNDPTFGAYGVIYLDGTLSFYPSDGGHRIYFFTNRNASAGRTLRINVDPSPGYQFAIAGIDYVNLQTVLGGDIPSNVTPVHTAQDNRLTLRAFADTAGTIPANLYPNVDWFGVAGGNNPEAVEGTESLQLEFSGGAGLSGLGTRYTSGQILISGFASDPGFTDPSGIATGVSYADGTLTYTFNAPRAPEILVTFANPAASAGRTLTLRTDGGAGSQIALTRISYAVPPPSLGITRHGVEVVLTWSAGTLQQASAVSGTYTDVPGATSPYTNAISGAQRYFRLRVP